MRAPVIRSCASASSTVKTGAAKAADVAQPDPPTMRQPNFVAERGRGLHIVDALCESWDCVRSGGGKAVIVILPC